MKLIKKYIDTLKTIDIEVDGDHNLVVNRLKDKRPFQAAIVLGGETKATVFPVILPTKQVLDAGENVQEIKFNPMGENFLSDRSSEVQKELNVEASKALSLRVTALYQGIAYVLLNPEARESLSQEAFEFIKGIKPPTSDSASKRVQSYVNSVLKQGTGHRGQKAMARIRQTGMVKAEGKNYYRTTELIMPFMMQAQKEVPLGINPPNKAACAIVQGIAKRLNDHLALKDLCETDIAPYFSSWLSLMSEVTDRIQKLSELFRVDIGDNFKHSINYKPQDLKALYEKELNIRFPGNVGMSEEQNQGRNEAIASNQVAAVDTTKSTAAPVLDKLEEKVVSVPAVTTQPTATPAPTQSHIIESGRRRMPIVNTASVNTVQTFNQQPYSYDPGNLSGKPEAVAAPAAAPQVTPAASAPAVERATAPQVAPAASAPMVERAETRIHVKDANQQPLYMQNGQPYLLEQSQVPQMNFVQKKDAMNRPMFNSDGSPALKEAVAMGGAPMAPAQQAPMNPYQAMALQQNQQQQNMTQMMPPMFNMMRQQVQPAFDQMGNITNGPLMLQNGQQVTNMMQIQQMIQQMQMMASTQQNTGVPSMWQQPAQQQQTVSHF